jgi:hypothetical protein
MEAVAGEPETTFWTPALVPSTVKVTVPLGGVVPTVGDRGRCGAEEVGVAAVGGLEGVSS